MPIVKTEILGSQREINYEKNEYKKLINLIDNFKKRLNEFPNNGRISNKDIIFLAGLKAEDELEELKELLNFTKKQNKEIENKNLSIDDLKKEIVLLKDQIKTLESNNLVKDNDYSKACDYIEKLGNEIDSIKTKIKEVVNE